ncbi:MAG: LPS export ABC transporter permease LptF [Gammaproteobacteria bacterium]
MIFERYLMKEYLRMFGMIIGGLLVVYFTTRLAAYLGEAADGKMAPGHIAALLGLKMLVSMRDLVPMSLYIGIFATIIRLQRDFELTALRAAGGSPRILLLAAFKLAVLSGSFVGALTLFAEPRAEEVIEEIKDQTENEATIAGVKAGRFKELSGGQRIFYAEKISQDEMLLQNAFVQIREGSDVGLMRSDDAYVETDPTSGDRFAVFIDGTSYAGRPGALDYVITRFAKYALRIESRTPTDVSNQVNYMRTSDLVKYDATGFKAELHWRIARPVGALLLPLLAVLIALASTGENWYLGLLTAISGYFVYGNLLGVANALVRKGTVAPEFGTWLVQIALLALLGALYWLLRRPRSLRAAPGRSA